MKVTTTGWVNALYSFAILSLRFFLHSAPVAQFPVEIVGVMEKQKGFRAGLLAKLGERTALLKRISCRLPSYLIQRALRSASLHVRGRNNQAL